MSFLIVYLAIGAAFGSGIHQYCRTYCETRRDHVAAFCAGLFAWPWVLGATCARIMNRFDEEDTER
jgi:hypothetical protein